ncbi:MULTISPECIES: hypothetical protein [Devosia]|uniref:hypothetical protein n=1 Tax=Devosia TaxID=46913 RepID=UPI000CE9722F|nr:MULTISPECIES: hypothetical protein [Devosia]AVF04732.1 hypothetical protein C4375_14135 [Devosia sp. I507]
MSRLAARIRHDEVTRMVKAAKACGLPIYGIQFDGATVTVITEESRDKPTGGLDRGAGSEPVQEVDTL